MKEGLLLVDYENVGQVELEAIPEHVHVLFFFGASQRSVPTGLLKGALKLGKRFVAIDIEGRGKNALDFHIAFYLGECLATSPRQHCSILSNDKGFDPLIKHLLGRGFTVRRVGSVKQAFGQPRAAPSRETPSAFQELAVRWLSGMQKNKRPRKRKGLVSYLESRFGRKVSEQDVQKLVDRMVSDKQLVDTGGAITYYL